MNDVMQLEPKEKEFMMFLYKTREEYRSLFLYARELGYDKDRAQVEAGYQIAVKYDFGC